MLDYFCITHKQWAELKKMHAPTAVKDSTVIWTGPCAACKDPGEGNWCATYQWLVRVATSEKSRERDVASLIRQIRDQDDVLDELVMSAELATVYRDDRALARLRDALAGWREASEDPR